jgi:hypothetical protein
MGLKIEVVKMMQLTPPIQDNELPLMDAKTTVYMEAQAEIFERLKPQLLETYVGQYVWLVGEEVKDADRDFAVLFDRVMKQVGEEPMFIRRVVVEARSPMVRGAVMGRRFWGDHF